MQDKQTNKQNKGGRKRKSGAGVAKKKEIFVSNISWVTVWRWEIYSSPSGSYVIKDTSIKRTFVSPMSNFFGSVFGSIFFGGNLFSIVVVIVEHDFDMLRLLKHLWWFEQLLQYVKIVFVLAKKIAEKFIYEFRLDSAKERKKKSFRLKFFFLLFFNAASHQNSFFVCMCVCIWK